MERTTIYLDDTIRRQLLEISAEESKRKRKHTGMAMIIREAVVEHLKKYNKIVDGSVPVTGRENTKNIGIFEKRLEDIQKDLTNLKRELKKFRKSQKGREV